MKAGNTKCDFCGIEIRTGDLYIPFLEIHVYRGRFFGILDSIAKSLSDGRRCLPCSVNTIKTAGESKMTSQTKLHRRLK